MQELFVLMCKQQGHFIILYAIYLYLQYTYLYLLKHTKGFSFTFTATF